MARALRRDRVGRGVLGEQVGDAAVDRGGARLFVPLIVGQRGDGEVESFAERGRPSRTRSYHCTHGSQLLASSSSIQVRRRPSFGDPFRHSPGHNGAATSATARPCSIATASARIADGSGSSGAAWRRRRRSMIAASAAAVASARGSGIGSVSGGAGGSRKGTVGGQAAALACGRGGGGSGVGGASLQNAGTDISRLPTRQSGT